MEGKIVIVAYKPKQGKENALQDLMRKHYDILSGQGLVTDRPSILMQAKDGTIVEVFEWKNEAAIKAAHTNEALGKLWGEYAEACDYLPLNNLPEANNMFAEFMPFE